MPEEVQLSAHDAAMVAKVDEAHAALSGEPKPPAATPTVPQRPEHIPEKFWDAAKGVPKVDELAKSYAELEKAKSQAPAASGDTKPADGPKEPDKAAEEASKATGGAVAPADIAAMNAEFAKDGKLSDARYAELAAKGFPKEIVDDFISSKQKVAEYEKNAAVSEAHAVAGGAEQYNSMLTWAASALNQADADAFDTAVTSGNAATRNQAITALKARYEAAQGKDPTLVSGDGAGGAEGAFSSNAEMTAAMRDPRYRKDPAYRAMVERRTGLMP